VSDRDAGLEQFQTSSSSLPPGAEVLARDPKDLPVREGLPAHYRMRADAHYVDQLDAPPASSIQMVALEAIEPPEQTVIPSAALLESMARHGVLEPLLVRKRDRRYTLLAGRRRLTAARALGLRDVPCIVRRLTDEEARSIAPTRQAPVDSAAPPAGVDAVLGMREIATSLSAVVSCADLLSGGVPPLTRSVAVDMVRAEALRALHTLRTVGYLREGIPPSASAVPVRRLVAAVIDAVGPDVRLRGSRLSTRIDVEDDVTVVVDEPCLVSTVTSVVLLLSAGLGEVRGAGLSVTVTSDPRAATLTIAQESVILPGDMLARAAGDLPVDSSVAPLVVLRQLAESCGGACTVSRLARGTQVSVSVPRCE
jgi:hypothetical protein